MRVLVTGASGLIGRRVVDHLRSKWHEVIPTSRHPRAHEWPPEVEVIAWDGERHLRVNGPLHGVVNLAGASIMGRRWTPARRKVLVDSRVRLTRHLSGFINSLPKPRPVLVNVSASGAYGSSPGPVSEQSPYGTDFLADLCRQWEEAALEARTRVVLLRVGIVLDPAGGYLGKILPFLRAGLGGPLGSGRQPVPWIHRDDLARMFVWALEEERASGIYNAVAATTDNATLTKTAARVLHRPAFMKVPAFVLRWRFGEAADAILNGQAVRSSRALEEGFQPTHTDLEKALRDLLPRSK